MRLLVLIALFLMQSEIAYSDPLITPGTACGLAGQIIHTGGPETGGTGHMMVCEGGQWRAFITFNGNGQITRMGDQSCLNGQVLSFNGSQWICGNKGQLQCNTVAAANCPAGFTKTGNTPDLLLGLGSYPVCCRVQ